MKRNKSSENWNSLIIINPYDFISEIPQNMIKSILNILKSTHLFEKQNDFLSLDFWKELSKLNDFTQISANEVRRILPFKWSLFFWPSDRYFLFFSAQSVFSPSENKT